MEVENLEFHIQRTGDAGAHGISNLSRALRRLQGESKGANKTTKGLLGTITRMTKLMLLRQAIRAVIKAAKEGLENVYKYAEQTGGHIATTMNTLKSLGTQMKNAFGSALGQALANILPILNAIASAAIAAANAIARLLAVLGGRSSYTKAVASSEKWAKATAGGAAAAKEWKNQLLGFDEINKLNDQDSGGGGGGGDIDGALEEVEAVSEWASKLREITLDWWNNINFDPLINSWDRLKTSLMDLAHVVDDYLYFAYTNVLLPIGQWTIEQGLPATIEMLASAFEFLSTTLEVFKPYAWWVFENWLKPLGEWVGDHFVFAMWRVQDAFVQAREYVKTLAGLSPAGVVDKLWTDFINAFQRVNWQGLGQKIIQMFRKALDFVKTKVTSASFASIVEKAATAAGSAIGAAAGIIYGAIMELLQGMIDKIMAWSSEMEATGTNLIIGLWNGITGQVGKVISWIDSHICRPFINAFKSAFGIHSPSTVMSDIGGNIIQGLADGMSGKTSVLTGLANSFKSILQGIADKASSVWQAVRNAVAGINSEANSVNLSNLSSSNVTVRSAEIRKDSNGQTIHTRAAGGYLDSGDIFVANENGRNELVGRIGNRSAVVNQPDIVAAVSQGVAGAVANVMSSGSRGGTQVAVFNINGKEFMRAVYNDMKSVSNERGTSLVNA